MTKFLTLLFAVCTGLAFWSMEDGNPTAINGVIGAGIGTVVFAAIAWLDRD